MATSLKDLREQLMGLPPHQRVELAYELFESVDQDDLEDDPAAIEAAWADEIKRRVDEYDAGAVASIPGAEVFAKARALVRQVEQEREGRT
jgi:putative addiction module component (TIGR02574 family)